MTPELDRHYLTLNDLRALLALRWWLRRCRVGGPMDGAGS